MGQKKVWIYCRVAHNGPDSASVLAAQRDGLEAHAKSMTSRLLVLPAIWGAASLWAVRVCWTSIRPQRMGRLMYS